MKLFEKKFTAEEIAKAFNEHLSVLTVSKGSLCCNRGTYETVANQQVLLRRMLEDLGVDSEYVSKILYARK